MTSGMVTPETKSSNSPSVDDEWKIFDPKELGGRGTYGLGISAVAPRPIAVITSQDQNGVLNCAPFSYTGLLSHDPPMVAHGLCISSAGKKDTLVNIEQTKQWVYNVLSESWINQANACAEQFEPEVNELEAAGLSTLPCAKIAVPRIKEAMVSFECELESTKEVFNDDGKHTTTIVFGRIVKYHVHKSVLKYSHDDVTCPVIDLEKMKFVGRVGDITYWPAGEGKALSMKRP
jgi:flavin reductase (DIM6/NTAB) family NADH-FMN oxidoreductase RutF